MEVGTKPTRATQPEWLTGAIFLVAGIAMLYFCYYFATVNNAFKATGVHTVGRVVDLETSRDGNKGSIVEYPVVSFRASDGVEYQFIGSQGGGPGTHYKNTDIKVVYDQSNPYHAITDESNPGVYILGFLGLVFAIVGIGLLKKYIWK